MKIGQYAGILLLISLFVLFQIHSAYHFFLLESGQLFLNEGAYFLEKWSRPGGGIQWIRGFLLQFYGLPFVGAAVTSLLIGSCSLLFYSLGRRFTSRFAIISGTIWIAGSLCIIVSDSNYLLDGLLGCLLLLLLLRICTSLKNNTIRIISSFISIGALIWTAGPVGILFPLLQIPFIRTRKESIFLGILPFLWSLILGMLFMQHNGIVSWSEFLSPQEYADPLIEGNKGWWWIATLMAATYSIPFLNRYQGRDSRISIFLQITGSLLLLGFLFRTYGATEDEQLKKMVWLSRQESWSEILKIKPDERNTLQKMNLVNLALAANGELGDKMFKYPQRGAQSLIQAWDNTLTGCFILSQIHYQMDDIASCQKYAFEGMVSSIRDGSAPLLCRLVQTHIIYGHYAVAEKYIRKLEKTLFYKEWAKKQRQYLWNEALIENSPIYSSKRASLGKAESCSSSGDLLRTLRTICRNNPQNQSALQYQIAFYLLNKDLARYKSFLEEQTQYRQLPKLSRAHQEAIIFLYPEQRSYWIRYGVSSDVQRNFNLFTQETAFLKDKSSVMKVLNDHYADTFWNYVYNQ